MSAVRRQRSSFPLRDSFIPHAHPARSYDDHLHSADEGTKAQSGGKRCPAVTNPEGSGPARPDRKRGPADTQRATTSGRGCSYHPEGDCHLTNATLRPRGGPEGVNTRRESRRPGTREGYPRRGSSLPASPGSPAARSTPAASTARGPP